MHQRPTGIEIHLEVNAFLGQAGLLYFDGLQHHLVDGDGAHLHLGFVGIPKQLAQDRGSPLRLLEDMAHLAVPFAGVFLLQQPLRIAEDAGEGIIQLVRDAGDNLPKRR